MTLAEISFCLDDDLGRKRPPLGGRPMAHEEVVEHVRRLRAMTPRERLEYYRNG